MKQPKSGRPPKYTSETKNITFRIPKEAEQEVKQAVREIIKKYLK